MKHIRKSAEPPELAQYRQRFDQQFQRWPDLKRNRKTYNAIRDTLATDQKGLCAYCEMTLDERDRAVEHFIPCKQSTPENNLDLNWQNMLATCQGGLQKVQVPGEDALRNSRPPNNFPCCGGAKADFVPDGRLLNPLELPTRLLFRFRRLDGSIVPDQSACEQEGISVEQAQFTIKKLNLNVQRLKDRRLDVIKQIEIDLEVPEDSDQDDTALEIKLAAEYFGDREGDWPKFFSTLRFALGDGAEQYLSQFF